MVTGANGFFGSSFLRELESRSDVSYAGIRRSSDGTSLSKQYTSDYSIPSLIQILREFRPNVVIHVAGAASVAASIANPEADFEASVGLTQRLLSALAEVSYQPKIFYASTAAVYGNPKRLPIQENDELQPISPYGHHRLQCERLILDYAKRAETSAVIGRAFSVFGANQRRLVLWEIAMQAIRSPQITIQGTGNETRDFLSIEEYVRRALSLLLLPLSDSVTVNLASGQSRTIASLAHDILKVARRDVPIICLNQERPGDPRFWQANIDLYRRLSGDLQESKFSEDLAKSFEVWESSLKNDPINSPTKSL